MVYGGLMNNKRLNHRWFSRHSHEVFEIIGNIAAVAVFIGITYLVLRYLIKYG
jgi:hypothetical protein